MDKKLIIQKEDQLWRSPLGKKWFVFWVLFFLFLTIIKFCSNTVFIPIPEKYLAVDKINICYDLFNLILYGAWIILPPLAFLIEYIFIFGKDEKRRMDPIQCDDLKYCHDLASKVWAGVGVFLSVILLFKYGFKF